MANRACYSCSSIVSRNYFSCRSKFDTKFLDENSITYKNICVEHDDIFSIKIDRGIIHRHSCEKGLHLGLVTKKGSRIPIKNPSFLLILALIKRFKNPKVRYVRIKEAKFEMTIMLSTVAGVACCTLIYSMIYFKRV